MTPSEIKAWCKVVVRYGVPGDWHYLVLHDDAGTVFSDEQGAAFRFDSPDEAREAIRTVVRGCEDPDVAKTIRPVRLLGTKFVRRQAP
jgi:hypothetical protein